MEITTVKKLHTAWFHCCDISCKGKVIRTKVGSSLEVGDGGEGGRRQCQDSFSATEHRRIWRRGGCRLDCTSFSLSWWLHCYIHVCKLSELYAKMRKIDCK